MQRLEQAFLRQVRLLLDELRLLLQLVIENFLFRLGRQVGAGRHGKRAGADRGGARHQDHEAARTGGLHAGQQPDGADEAVLDAENEFAHAAARLDLFALFLDRVRHDQYLCSDPPVASPGFQSAGHKRPVHRARNTRSVSSTLRPTFMLDAALYWMMPSGSMT